MKKKTQYLPLENIVFKMRHCVSTKMIQGVDFDIVAITKRQMAQQLANLIIEHKKFAIQSPLDKLKINFDIGEFLNSTIDQEVEFSLELVCMTREELRHYVNAKILTLTYANFTKLKKENK